MSTIYYDDSHQKIIEGGISEIKRVLLGNDTPEIKSVLLCLDFYLDPYYKNTLSYETEIYDLLQGLVICSQDDDIIRACLQLIGNYSCIPLSILEENFDKVKDNWKPDVRYILNQP